MARVRARIRRSNGLSREQIYITPGTRECIVANSIIPQQVRVRSRLPAVVLPSEDSKFLLTAVAFLSRIVGLPIDTISTPQIIQPRLGHSERIVRSHLAESSHMASAFASSSSAMAPRSSSKIRKH